jgi:hypothetical protein
MLSLLRHDLQSHSSGKHSLQPNVPLGRLI